MSGTTRCMSLFWSIDHRRSGGNRTPRTALPALSVIRVIEPGQPGGQPLHGGLELRVHVGELAEPLGQPGQRDLLLTPAPGQLLDPAVGEVHGSVPAFPAVCLDPAVTSSQARSCALLDP